MLKSTYLPALTILIILGGTINKLLPDRLPQLYNYTIYIIYGVTCLIYYLNNFSRIHKAYKYLSYTYIYILLYLAIGIIKQWDEPSGLFPFIRLNIAMALLSFGSIFIFIYEIHLVFRIFKLWWQFIPIIFIFTFWILEPSQYIQILSYCLFYIFLLPLFNKKRQCIIILAILFVSIHGIEQRIDYINIAFPLLLFLFIKITRQLSKKVYMIIINGLMLLPIIFVILFFYNGYNILKLDQFIGDDIQAAGQLNVDTRSFLYEEAWSSGLNNQNLIQGRTPFYGYDSSFAESREGSSLIVKGKQAQRISEVFIVNTLTWFGIIGIIIFFFFYYSITISTIRKTKNLYLIYFSLYIAFFWIESWISHSLFQPNASYILLFSVIAICFNKQIQKMSTTEIIIYLKRNLNR